MRARQPASKFFLAARFACRWAALAAAFSAGAGALVGGAAAADAPPAIGKPVPYATQDLVVARMNRLLVLPESAHWRFDFIRPNPGSGDIVCGWVEYQNSAKMYRGPHRFFASIINGRIDAVQLESDDPRRNRALDFDFASLCDRK